MTVIFAGCASEWAWITPPASHRFLVITFFRLFSCSWVISFFALSLDAAPSWMKRAARSCWVSGDGVIVCIVKNDLQFIILLSSFATLITLSCLIGLTSELWKTRLLGSSLLSLCLCFDLFDFFVVAIQGLHRLLFHSWHEQVLQVLIILHLSVCACWFLRSSTFGRQCRCLLVKSWGASSTVHLRQGLLSRHTCLNNFDRSSLLTYGKANRISVNKRTLGLG